VANFNYYWKVQVVKKLISLAKHYLILVLENAKIQMIYLLKFAPIFHQKLRIYSEDT
jgi:hypothetical protein